MAPIGYHGSHEQFPPGELLSLVSLAHRAGFRAAMCSDHFHLWSERQGQSGFAWSWLGAALQATPLPFGVVNAPGQRYHPAILGFDVIFVHQVGRDQQTFLRVFGEQVLPRIAQQRTARTPFHA